MATAVQPTQRRIERPAAAEVARARPDGFVLRRIELAADELGHEAAERGADLVRTGRKELADQADDPRVDAGQRRRKLDPVAVVEQPAAFDRLVLPGDAKQVDRIDIPQADVFEPLLDLLRHRLRIAHLGERRQQNLPLAKALDRPRQELLR